MSSEELFLPDFLITPSAIVTDQDLQPLDGYVYGVVYWFKKLRLQRCTLTNNQIGQLLHASASGVSHSLSRLSQKNYVEIVMNSQNQREEIIPLVSFTSKEDLEIIEAVPSLKRARGVAQTNHQDSSNEQHTINKKRNKIIKKKNTVEAKASVGKKKVNNSVDNSQKQTQRGLSSIGDILKHGDPTAYIGKARTKTGGAKYEWQDRAARYAQKLGIKPDGGWFKLFKTGDPSALDAALSTVADAGADDPRLYFYKIYYNKVNKILPKWLTR